MYIINATNNHVADNAVKFFDMALSRLKESMPLSDEEQKTMGELALGLVEGNYACNAEDWGMVKDCEAILK